MRVGVMMGPRKIFAQTKFHQIWLVNSQEKWISRLGRTYSRVPITRHSMFIRHIPCIWPDTFTKKWDMMFNKCCLEVYQFWGGSFLMSHNLQLVFGSCRSKWESWLIFHRRYFQSCEPLLFFSTSHKQSGKSLHLFSTPLLIGTQE